MAATAITAVAAKMLGHRSGAVTAMPTSETTIANTESVAKAGCRLLDSFEQRA